jgi:DNA (cytosine-5)-methyltransferase 3A
MNVLSLFDGMSCGQIALTQLGFKVDNYFASEIDKYAMQIAKKNFPNIKHIGDVTKVKGSELPKIDLLIGGSPCQGFSFAGKQLNFNDPRSALFFEFVRLLKETNPKYFLLENVRMKKECQDVISEYLGVQPILINSSLVSAQSRNRLYWTNIPNIIQPTDKGILLKDILEDLPFNDQPNYLKGTFGDKTRGEMVKSIDDKKSHCLTASMWKGQIPTFIKNKPIQVGIANDIKGFDCIKRIYSEEGKSPTLTTMVGGHRQPKIACGALRGRYYDENGKRTDHKESVAGKTTQMLEIRNDDKTNTITTVQKDNVLTENNMYYRKLTPLECERLQTVPDGYTEGVSNTQRYKMLGNGWTVDVIKHIFRNMNEL